MAIPLFFGPPGRQLFGYHHVPRGTPRCAVLLCPAWGPEYQYSHRSLSVLARRLRESGAHVLRFDYSGTGDSWGDTTDTSIERAEEDVAHAARELRLTSGLEEIDFVGLRLGAWLAARVAPVVSGLRTLVLWDPISNGQDWIAEMGGATAFEHGVFELGAQLVSARFVDEVGAIRPSSSSPAGAGEVVVLVTQGNGEAPKTADAEGHRTEFLAQPAPWVEDESTWSGTVPTEAVKRIVTWLT